MKFTYLFLLVLMACSSNEIDDQPDTRTPDTDTDQDPNPNPDLDPNNSVDLNLPDIFVYGLDQVSEPYKLKLSKINSAGEIEISYNISQESNMSMSSKHSFEGNEFYLQSYNSKYFRKNLVTGGNFFIEDICDPDIMNQHTIAFSDSDIIMFGPSELGFSSRKYNIDSMECAEFVKPSEDLVFNPFAKIVDDKIFWISNNYELNSYFIESASILTGELTGKIRVEDPHDNIGNGNPFVADFEGNELHVWSETQYTVYDSDTFEVLSTPPSPYFLYGEYTNEFVDQRMADNIIVSKGSCPPPCANTGYLLPVYMDSGDVVEGFNAFPSNIEENLREFNYFNPQLLTGTADIKEELLIYGMYTIFGDEYVYAILYVNFSGEIVHVVRIPFNPSEVYILPKP